MVVTKNQHKNWFCYRGTSTPSQNQQQNLHRHHALHLCFALAPPPYPLSTYPPDGEGSCGRIPNILPLSVGGGWFDNTPKSTLFFSASPGERSSLPSSLCNRYPASPRKTTASATGYGNEGARAVCNRYPASPRKKIASATGHGNEGAIGLTHRFCFRVAATLMLEPRGITIRRIILDDLLFLKARRQGRREDVKWHGCALVVGMRNTDQYHCTWQRQ